MFVRDLLYVDIVDLTRMIEAGGKHSVGFRAKFVFKNHPEADEEGPGPTVEISSAVDLEDGDTIQSIEKKARNKAVAIAARIGAAPDAELDEVIARNEALDRRTKSERDADMQEEFRRSMEAAGKPID